MLKGEPFLHEMVLKYGIEIVAPNAFETIFQRFRRRVALIMFLLSVIIPKSFFLDIHLLGKFGKIVARINKWTHEESLGLLLSNLESRAGAYFNEGKELNRKPPLFIAEPYDGLLVSFKTENLEITKI